MNSNILPFQNYSKRRSIVDKELDKVNDEITNITGKITLLKYRLQKHLVDYHHTLYQKSEVDKLLSFHLTSSLNHPKLDIDGYTKELSRISKLYRKFRNKHIDKMPNNVTMDINIYFPDANRWKIDHLAEIRKEVKETIGQNHYQLQKQEMRLFEEFQNKKHNLEWTLNQIDNDKSINQNEKKRKTKNIKDAMTKMENDMIEHFSSLSKSFPDLIQETQLMDNMSNNELKKFPIRLEEDPDDKAETRLIKRRLILLKMKQDKCQHKIDKISKTIDDKAKDIGTMKMYENAKEIGEFTHSAAKKKNEIRKMKNEITKQDKYMTNLLESRDILMEEISLLENMESLTQNDIINDLFRSRHTIDMNEEEEDYLNQIPLECIVDDNMTNIDIEGINLDMIPIGINDEITFEVPTNTDNIKFDKMNDSHRKILKQNMNDKLDEKTQKELDKLKHEEDNLPLEYANIFMEIEKNLSVSDLPDSVQVHLKQLNNKLSQLEKIKFDATFEKSSGKNEDDTFRKNIGKNEDDTFRKNIGKNEDDTFSKGNNTFDNKQSDINIDENIDDMMDDNLLEAFKDFSNKLDENNILENNNFEEFNINGFNTNETIQNNLSGLIQINQN